MDITYFYLCNRYYLFYAINRHRPFDFPQISVQRYYFFPIYTNYFAFFSLLLDSRLYFPLMSKPNRNFHNPPSNDYQSPSPLIANVHPHL